MAAGLILEQGIVYIHIEFFRVQWKIVTWYLSIEDFNLIFEVSIASSNYFKPLEVRHVPPVLGINTLSGVSLGWCGDRC